ncbi:spore germination protein [Paenibacillus kribbensis]|uniref:spore germination protein n=1 Tax=Paenibacillus kribbensis TaxID=172713 RepID=UPI002DB8216F|nr:spore germination protein [Paenibacillus kribbensis]MEC0236873.1 spore germination protein [Paenibacillus kribbensis]
MWRTIMTHVPKWTVWIEALFLFIVPLVIFLVVRQIRKLDGRESRRMERLKLMEEQDRSKHADRNTLASEKEGETFTEDYQANVEKIRRAAADMADVNERSIFLENLNAAGTLFFVDGLTDKVGMDQNVLKPLMDWGRSGQEGDEPPRGESLRDMIIRQVMLVSETECTLEVQYALQKVLFGSVVLMIQGIPGAFVLGTPKGNTRGVEDPISESVLRGPRVGFTETLSDNTAMLRRHGESTELAMSSFKVGKRVEKQLMVVYFRDIADPELVDEVKRRIKTIDMDEVLESGYVEQLIEDNFLSPFLQIQNTERPDRVMAALLEGRVAILLDGTPFALLVPVTYGMMLQSPEDYYERWIPGSLIRFLRFMAISISLFAPALYISFISFHPGLIPTKLVISIISSRQGVPFSTLIEALIMEISIEILREAGLRLPKPIGPAMGIVGGLIIGQAAVNAGIVSPILVIVVAVTAISSFTTPVYSAGISMRVLRFAAMFTAATFGLYGVIMFFLMLSIHMAKLHSFGVPFLSLTAPRSLKDWKDYLIRAPFQFMKNRPILLKHKDPKRQG